MRRYSLLLATLLLAMTALPAAASPLPTVIMFNNSNGCGGSTCFGNQFTLTITPTGSTYDVQLAVNTAGNTNAGTGLAAVDFKFGGGITGGVLNSFDGGSPALWTSSQGTLNANSGCNYNAQGSFECAVDTTFQGLNNGSSSVNPLAPLNGATHIWDWTGISANGSLTSDQIHIGALFGYINSSTSTNSTCTGKGKNKVCTNSTTTTYSFKQTGNLSGSGDAPLPPPPAVPEPASIALFASGLAGLAPLMRRLKR